MSRPDTSEATLVYDGDCGFCTRSAGWLARLRPIGLAQPRVVAWQHADLAALGLTREQCRAQVQWAQDGRSDGGARAVARLLLASAGPWRAAGGLLLVPPLSWLAAAAYRLVAANRSRLPGGTPACQLPPDRRPGAPPAGQRRPGAAVDRSIP